MLAGTIDMKRGTLPITKDKRERDRYEARDVSNYRETVDTRRGGFSNYEETREWALRILEALVSLRR